MNIHTDTFEGKEFLAEFLAEVLSRVRVMSYQFDDLDVCI